MTNEQTPRLGSTVLGYPRIGPRRELKRALERYWKGTASEAELHAVAQQLRASTWRELADAGLDSIPGNTFSYYDHVLDIATLFGAVPERYATLGLSPLDTYFAMARGTAEIEPLEMTKWFATNYHYLVPEIGPATRFRLAGDKPLAEYREAVSLGIETRPVLVGPATFLLLCKADTTAPDGWDPLDKLDELLDAYAALLRALAESGASWVQLDEPAFVADRDEHELAALRRAYDRLAELPTRPSLLVTGPYGDLGDALDVLAATSVEAIGVDLVAGRPSVSRLAALPGLRHKTIAAGVVDGHNVWRSDVDSALSVCATLLGSAGRVEVTTSCSLLHVPYDIDAEPAALDENHPGLRDWLAFARQKVHEVVLLARGLRDGQDAVAGELAAARAASGTRRDAPALRDGRVRSRVGALRPEDAEREPYARRALAQRATLGLPELPTTTIGSFPQTAEVRKARAALRDGTIDEAEYTGRIRAEVENVVALQERVGLDVLVHGEPERNDMVQYFAEQLAGYATTELGWVQSYGSRCVRPPVLYGDVARPGPLTVGWAEFAQSLTPKPVKGMLTGPVTMLAWSFVRDDQPVADTARQVALAIRDEVTDLESAGIGVIQVDEPALRELLPLRASAHAEYLAWAVHAFRLATSGVAEQTQIHTHMCYSEFGDILGAIDDIDADVTSIEAARSRMEVLAELGGSGFRRGVGPGVYDIHSPRVPGDAEMADLLRAALRHVEKDRLWANPDCGLKTRGYTEVEPALANLVAATRTVRAEHAS